MENVKKILGLLTSREKKQFYFLFILILFMALLEALGVASILPFFSILTNPELVESNKYLIYLYNLSNKFGINNINDFILLFGALTFVLFIMSLLIKAIATYLQIRFTLMREFTIGKRLIEGYLHQPYNWFLKKNSAELGKSILSEVSLVIYGSIIPLINLIAQTTVALALITLIFIVDPFLALRVALVLATCYLIIFLTLKNFISKIGHERVKDNDTRFKIVSEAFGAVKEIKFGGLEKKYINRFVEPAKNYAKSLSLVQIIGQLPRYFLEGVALGGMIILVSYLVVSGKNFSGIIPVLALYAFAGYRLIPALQQIYASLTQLNFSRTALNSLHNDLINLKYKNNENNNQSILIKKHIRLENIKFRYSENKKFVLKNISLSIPTLSKVGFIGSTGAGKTTLIDVILGLLSPQGGKFFVDETTITSKNIRNWQKLIGYVPQQIYLSDDTLASNIAFGVDPKDINFKSLEETTKIANLHNFILDELPNGYETMIGERGIRLSGGQRQRIGIARALYHNPQLLILDEATSSLDNITEKAISDAINNLKNKITIIIIAHRLTTLKNCDKIYLLDNGLIKSSGNYNELLTNSDQFKAMNKV
ncbi:MAG: ABC transporter ATP-binding protein [Candidatus Endolissoclinum sp. TMED37]|nr:MAG: ABC transporter ATP-binding protein [Candidatus Endolissoclinum sp. TMED37]